MRAALRNEVAPTRHLVRATLLLAGLLSVGHGYFNDDRTYLLVGVAVIVANVLSGIVDLLTSEG